MVALVGVALPFVFGYAACWMLGFDTLAAVVAGATLTATSVSITARVLADLGRLQAPESPIILDAAVLDDDNRQGQPSSFVEIGAIQEGIHKGENCAQDFLCFFSGIFPYMP